MQQLHNSPIFEIGKLEMSESVKSNTNEENL